MKFLALLLLTSWFACTEPIHQESATAPLLDLNHGWTFRQVGTEDWLEAKVPGTVQQDLIRHKLMPNPLVEENEKEIEWVSSSSWEYQREFTLAEVPENKFLTFTFKGLDTYASVSLNDEMYFNTDNMFRSWSFTIPRSKLREKNLLKVVFHPAVDKGIKAEKELGYALPASNDAGKNKVSSFIRKAPFQFGWDWSPRVVTAGIWKEVTLEGWDNFKLESMRLIQDSIVDNTVYGKVEFEITTKEKQMLSLKANLDGREILTKDVQANPGTTKTLHNFQLKDIELWWPNGWGEAKLYHLSAEVSKGEETAQELSKKVGFRTIELIQEPDKIGTSFNFLINGEPLFAKGANYTPQGIFPGSVNKEQCLQLLEDAKAANFNMIRVWGGGIYESDQFYDLCDSLGLLVWQDFMFACSMYPSDFEFVNNVQQEAREQVTRLSDHACMALWCGNNEVNVAWGNWGWQAQFEYSEEQQQEIAKGYTMVFEGVLKEAVAENSNLPYIHSSPLSNWGKEENFNHHNMHYWGVWHGTDNFDGLAKYVPRFMSEYGFQSFPHALAFNNQLESSPLDLKDPLLLHRQKSYKTNKELIRHLKQHYPLSKTYSEFAYLSQLNQKLAMEIAINAHRTDRSRCAGTLYWQLNDVWAAPTWSTIDYSGDWKAAHYLVRDRYQPIIVIPEVKKNQMTFHISNDSRDQANIEGFVTALNFEGDTLGTRSFLCKAAPNSSQPAISWSVESLIRNTPKNQVVLVAQIQDNGLLVDEEIITLGEPKDLGLTKADPKISVTPKGGKYLITVTSDTFLKEAFLDFGVTGTWSDNFTDILPNRPTTFQFTPKGKVDENALHILTLNQLLEKK